MPARVVTELELLYKTVEDDIVDVEERLDLTHEIRTIKNNLPIYVGHLARGYHETSNKARVLETLHPNEFVEVSDWKMKWLMLLMRETQVHPILTRTLVLVHPILVTHTCTYQVDFFGKAGTSWHGCMFMMTDPEDRYMSRSHSHTHTHFPPPSLSLSMQV